MSGPLPGSRRLATQAVARCRGALPTPQRPTSDLTQARSIIAALLATRAGLVLVGLVALAIMPRGDSRFEYAPNAPWLSMWARWDSEYYRDIAVDGYSFDPARLSNVAFFPLYPVLIRIATLLLGRTDDATVTLVGVLISNVALVVALLYLVALVARDLGVDVARRTVLYFLVFPATFFLSAVYAESLFLATAVASLSHARRGEWYRAGLAGGLAALTRPFGVLLVIPLAIEMARQRPAMRSIPALALIPAGTATFFAFLWWRFGDPLLYVRANSAFGRVFAAPWETALDFIRGPLLIFGWPHSVVDLCFIVGMAVLAVIAWRRLPPSYAAFTTAGLLFSISTDLPVSTPRHALALFPLLIVLAVAGEWRWFHRGWLTVSVVVGIIFMARFATGNWVA